MAKKQTEIVPSAPTPLAKTGPPPSAAVTDITQLLAVAVEKQVPVETMERLVALHERMSDRAAAQEFAASLAAFQSECPSISRSSTANITTKSGARFSYQYADLNEIVKSIRPLLHARGLSYSWDSTTASGILTCICKLRHVNGHIEEASFTAPTESSAGMSEQQKCAAALTFARRQSLVQVLGLTTCDPDTDAALGSPEPITSVQVLKLLDLIKESEADMARFLKFAKVKKLEEVMQRDYAGLVSALAAKKSGKNEDDMTDADYDEIADAARKQNKT